MNEIATTNDFLLGSHGDYLVFGLRPMSLTRDQALRLAAYLVLLADVGQKPSFDDYLKAVSNA